MDDFAILLASNVASENIFADNKICNFATKLPIPLSLEGEWEVGLADMSYSVSWYNITSNQAIQLILCEEGSHQLFGLFTGMVPAGHYDTIEEILDIITEEIRKISILNDYESVPSLILAKHSRKITIKNGVKENKIAFLSFGPELSNILGFVPE